MIWSWTTPAAHEWHTHSAPALAFTLTGDKPFAMWTASDCRVGALVTQIVPAPVTSSDRQHCTAVCSVPRPDRPLCCRRTGMRSSAQIAGLGAREPEFLMLPEAFRNTV